MSAGAPTLLLKFPARERTLGSIMTMRTIAFLLEGSTILTVGSIMTMRTIMEAQKSSAMNALLTHFSSYNDKEIVFSFYKGILIIL
jgi:hypothetical protein